MHNRKRQAHSLGFSLVEVALLLMMASLAFLPVIQLLGGKAQGSRDGSSAATLNRQRTRELVAANNIMERAMAGEVLSFNVNNLGQLYNSNALNAFNINAVPISGAPVRFPGSGTYEYGDESQGVRLTYRWTLKDVSHVPDATKPSGFRRITPQGNRIVKATLDVFEYGAPADAKPSYTFSTFLSNNDGYTEPTEPKVGVVMVLDLSGSMMDPGKGVAGQSAVSNIVSPYLKDRFHRKTTGLPSGMTLADLNLYDDRNLDITWSMPEDDLETPFNETYMRPGVLKLPTCSTQGQFMNEDADLEWFVKYQNSNGNRKKQWDEYFKRLCGDNTGQTESWWTDNVVKYVPRIEASRNALLSFTVAVESDVELVRNLDLGFVTFESKGNEEKVVYDLFGTKKILESPQPIEDPANNNQQRLRYKKLRDKLSWINRFDENRDDAGGKSQSIVANGATYTRGGIDEAAEMLRDTPNLTNRIILLLTDGDPNPNSGDNARNKLVERSEQLWNDPNTPISTYTIGFSGLSKEGQKMLEDMAKKSNGQFFYANDANDLKKIFFALSYELRKQLIMARVERYNEDLAAHLKG